MTSIQHIVASGCSQTADGIGGCPPEIDSEGGCSFVHGNAIPASWVGFVAQALSAQSLVNMAASSHGNYYVAHTIIAVLSKYRYMADRTLVIFNLSEPLRSDIPCAFDHPQRCKYVPYNHDILPGSWLDRSSAMHKNIVKNIGIEQIAAINRVALISLFAFLEQHQYRYLFTTMNDYSDDQYIGDLVSTNRNRIDLIPGNGIIEFATATRCLSDISHPNVHGHEKIAAQVLAKIQEKWI